MCFEHDEAYEAVNGYIMNVLFYFIYLFITIYYLLNLQIMYGNKYMEGDFI